MSGLRFCLVMYEKYISCAKSAPSSNCSHLSRLVPNLNIVKRVRPRGHVRFSTLPVVRILFSRLACF